MFASIRGTRIEMFLFNNLNHLKIALIDIYERTKR